MGFDCDMHTKKLTKLAAVTSSSWYQPPQNLRELWAPELEAGRLRRGGYYRREGPATSLPLPVSHDSLQ